MLEIAARVSLHHTVLYYYVLLRKDILDNYRANFYNYPRFQAQIGGLSEQLSLPRADGKGSGIEGFSKRMFLILKFPSMYICLPCISSPLAMFGNDWKSMVADTSGWNDVPLEE